jgi:lysine 2,3-aminomutase
LHRYPDRVLLKPILVCPVIAACFRREQVGGEEAPVVRRARRRV